MPRHVRPDRFQICFLPLQLKTLETKILLVSSPESYAYALIQKPAYFFGVTLLTAILRESQNSQPELPTALNIVNWVFAGHDRGCNQKHDIIPPKFRANRRMQLQTPAPRGDLAQRMRG